MRRIILISVALLLVAATLLSCKDAEPIFEHCELGIRLPSEFDPHDSDGAFDAAWSDGETVVGMYRISFDAAVDQEVPLTLSALGFAEYYLGLTDKTAEIAEYGTVAYYYYLSTAGGGGEYMYLLTFFRTPYSYFIISFISSSEDMENKISDYLELASTVYLKG